MSIPIEVWSVLFTLLAVGCMRSAAVNEAPQPEEAAAAPIIERSPETTPAGFYQEFWADDLAALSNSQGRRLRVNDPNASTHPKWGRRWEGSSNGLMIIDADLDLFESESAGLYLELWGGHPGTANKRVAVNGKALLDLPRSGTEAHDCTYTYPEISVPLNALVGGKNAFQFSCEAGDSFWGHYMIDNACLRVDLKPNHPAIRDSGLQGFSAQVRLEAQQATTLQDRQRIGIDIPESYRDRIESVEYFARNAGFDDTGSRRVNGWRGFTLHRKSVGHIGSAYDAPFEVMWDTSVLPGTDLPLAVRAVIRLEGGLLYRTEVLDNLHLRTGRPPVKLYRCEDAPRPFWSRANRLKKATIVLPDDLSDVMSAELYVKTWDGGAGREKTPFKINGHGYDIISGKSIHNVVFTRRTVDMNHLKPGTNEITLISETHHHGIEVLAPGPVLILNFK